MKVIQSSALNGAAHYLTIFSGIPHSSKILRKKTHKLKLKYSIQEFYYNRNLKTSQMTREVCTFCNEHTENIPHLFRRCDMVQHICLMVEKFVNGKFGHVTTNMELKDFVLFGNA